MDAIDTQASTEFRQHGSFWLRFAGLLLAGLLLVAFTWMTAGAAEASILLWAELSIALASGLR